MSVVTPAVTLKTSVVTFGPEGSGNSGLLTTVVLRLAPITPSVRFPFVYPCLSRLSLEWWEEKVRTG